MNAFALLSRAQYAIAFVVSVAILAALFLRARADKVSPKLPRKRDRWIGRLGWTLLSLLGLSPLLYQALLAFGLIEETWLRFGKPSFVYAIAISTLFLVWKLHALPLRHSPGRKRMVAFFASIAVLSAAYVSAEPEIGSPLDRMTVILAVDRSRSIDLVDQGEKRITSELLLAEASMHREDRIARVVFGTEAATEDPPHARTKTANAVRVGVGRDGTNLESAIRHAIAEIPSDSAGRVVIISDGVQTKGDALSAATSAMMLGVPVDTFLLEQKKMKDIRLVSVRGPSRVSKGEPLDLRVITSSAEDADVEIRLLRDGVPIHTGKTRIQKGEDTLRLRELATEPGLHRYDVAISALNPDLDSTPEDNKQSAFVRVIGPSLALILEGDPGRGAPFAAALEQTGAKTIERGLAGLPGDVGELAGFDLVVLSDIRASDLSPTQLEAFASYTRDLGGGLLLMGGDRSLGPGGFSRTPIEEVSPVSFDLKKEQKRGSLAEVIIIDYSGSMSATVATGQTKLALANEASARSAELLSSGDRLGVAHVDTTVAWTIPLSPVINPGAMAGKIRSVTTGGGGIYTDIALDAAYAALRKERVNLKHVLLFADGADAEQMTGCRAKVGAAFADGITTSVISLGKGSDTPELEVLSKVGNGRFYLIEDALRLPAVFAQETVLASKSAISEKPFRAALGSPTEATRNIPFGSAPDLLGYVITMPKPRATVGLVGPENDPLFATWSIGVGRSAVFTSDFKDRWGKQWLKWTGSLKFFSQVAQDIARKKDDPKVRLQASAEGSEFRIAADVVGDDGRTQSFRRFKAMVTGPDGFSKEVSMEAIGAGRYAGTLPLQRSGTYIASIKDENTMDLVGLAGATFTGADEITPTGSDRLMMERIASVSGGKTRDSLAGIFEERSKRRFAYKSYSTLLSALAALALLLSVVARRFGVPDALERTFARAEAWKSNRLANRIRSKEDAARSREAANELAVRNRELVEASKRRLKDATAQGRIVQGGIVQQALSQPTPPTPPSGAAAPPPTPAAKPPTPQGRTLSTAERLAQKRRDRKS
ncbi:MAG: VWA domain-containing protein [Polyangiaceae bacterium]|nr:VWA domain-containing protein [Polyangiaceae bacterium]